MFVEKFVDDDVIGFERVLRDIEKILLLNKNAYKIRGKFGAVLAISLGNLLGLLFVAASARPQIERLSSATPTLSNGNIKRQIELEGLRSRLPVGYIRPVSNVEFCMHRIQFTLDSTAIVKFDVCFKRRI